MEKQKKSVLFMGSGRFAVKVLTKLVSDSSISLLGVITQKDKPVGRKKVITPTYVRQFCLETKVNNWQAENSSEILDIVATQNLEFDFLIVADYGVILKESVLNLPKNVSLNVHGSILPKYRGASPVHAALLNQDELTGVSIITMTKGLDAGPVWKTLSLPILGEDNYESLLLKLGELGGDAILDVLTNFSSIKPVEQEDSSVSLAGKIDKNDGNLNFELETTGSVLAKLKAYSEWPGVFFEFKSKKFQIIRVDKVDDISIGTNRKIFSLNGRLFLNLPDSVLEIIDFKPESKNIMKVSDFLRGNANFFDSEVN
jgi:methionyl-tRNA formyltransferase